MPPQREVIANALKLQDQYDDLVVGFELWKQYKVASMELSALDEMLIRWVEHNRNEA